jgi:hypothetical protein
VTQNFLPLRQELLVEGRFLKHILVSSLRRIRHKLHQVDGYGVRLVKRYNLIDQQVYYKTSMLAFVTMHHIDGE